MLAVNHDIKAVLLRAMTYTAVLWLNHRAAVRVRNQYDGALRWCSRVRRIEINYYIASWRVWESIMVLFICRDALLNENSLLRTWNFDIMAILIGYRSSSYETSHASQRFAQWISITVIKGTRHWWVYFISNREIIFKWLYSIIHSKLPVSHRGTRNGT